MKKKKKNRTKKLKVKSAGKKSRKAKKIKIKKLARKQKKVRVLKSKKGNKKIKTVRIKLQTSLSKKDKRSIVPKIKVIGIGGGGGNAITRMFDYFPKGVDLIAINTDAQDLEYCHAKKKLVIGRQATKGM